VGEQHGINSESANCGQQAYQGKHPIEFWHDILHPTGIA
jgi:hypothetical protein